LVAWHLFPGERRASARCLVDSLKRGVIFGTGG
jgi:hypothetical protein